MVPETDSHFGSWLNRHLNNMYTNLKRFKENIDNINPEKIIGDTDNNLFLRQQIAPYKFLKPPLTTLDLSTHDDGN